MINAPSIVIIVVRQHFQSSKNDSFLFLQPYRWIRVYDITIRDNYAYIATYESGMRILDISNPLHPQEIGRYMGSSREGKIYLSDTLAFYTGFSRMYILDISNPANPYRLSTWEGEREIVDIVNIGDRVYLQSMGFRVIDVSDPTQPEEILYCREAELGVLDVHENFIYVGADDCIQLIDKSDPDSLNIVGSYNAPGWGRMVSVVDEYAYFAKTNAGLWVVDVFSPSEPQIMDFIELPDYIQDLAIDGYYAYLTINNGLSIIDISEPSDLLLVTTREFVNDAVSVDAEGDYAYVGMDNAGLRIFDIRLCL